MINVPYSSLFIIVSLSLMYGCRPFESTSSLGLPDEPFFGGVSEDMPEMVFPEVISTKYKELNGTFSLDGQQFYYSVDNPAGNHASIVFTELSQQWSAPDIAPFSGEFSDVDPIFAPKSDRIYFCSNRPKEPGGVIGDYDIWYVERKGMLWSEPINPGPPLNSPRNDFYPSSTLDGNIYFTRYDPERGTDDVHVAIPDDGGYRVENVGDSINTPHGEYDPFVSPYEDYILFTSYRSGDMGGGDIYISFKREDHWSPAIHLGSDINTVGREYCPLITFDQQYFIYTSTMGREERKKYSELSGLYSSYEDIVNGNGNIYWCKADWILALGNIK